MSTYQTPIPGAGYGQANLLARRAYDNAMSRYQQRRSQSLLKYGYKRDAAGTLSVDANNEYGGYQQMLRGQNDQSQQLDRQQRASGWGTGSGYLGQKRDQLQYGQGGEQARFGQEVTGEMADIAQGEQEAQYGYDAALWQNQQEAAQQAIQNDNFNPANYDGIDVPYGQQQPRPLPAPKRRNVHQQGRARLVRRAAKRVKGRRR